MALDDELLDTVSGGSAPLNDEPAEPYPPYVKGAVIVDFNSGGRP